MMDIEHEPLLYRAAVECMVGEQMVSSSWDRMCRWSIGMSEEGASEQFKATEERIKCEYGIKSMPATWRSNKSVILKAIKQHTSVIGDDGNAVPKTELEKVLKSKCPVPNIELYMLVSKLVELQNLFTQAKVEGMKLLPGQKDYLLIGIGRTIDTIKGIDNA